MVKQGWRLRAKLISKWLLFGLACCMSYTCNSRPRMVGGMLVRREKSDWVEFLSFWRPIVLSTCGFRQKWAELLCLTPFSSMGEATDTFERAHPHQLYDKDSGSTGPIAIAVSDDVSWQAWSNSLAVLPSSASFLPGRAIWLWRTSDVLPWYGYIHFCACSFRSVLSWCFSQTVNLHWVSVRL